MNADVEAIQAQREKFEQKRWAKTNELAEQIEKQRKFIDAYAEKRKTQDFPDIQYLALMAGFGSSDRDLVRQMVNDVESALASGYDGQIETPAEASRYDKLAKVMGLEADASPKRLGMLEKIDQHMSVGEYAKQQHYISPMYRPGEATWAEGSPSEGK